MNLRAFYILFFIPILCAPSAQCAEPATTESLSAQERSLQKRIDDITMELAQLSQSHETVSLSDVTDRVKALQNGLKAAKSEMLNCLVAQGKMSAAKRFWLKNRTGIIITSAVVVTALIACGIWYYKTRMGHGRLPVASVPPVVETPEVQAAVKIQSIYRGYLARRRVQAINLIKTTLESGFRTRGYDDFRNMLIDDWAYLLYPPTGNVSRSYLNGVERSVYDYRCGLAAQKVSKVRNYRSGREFILSTYNKQADHLEQVIFSCVNHKIEQGTLEEILNGRYQPLADAQKLLIDVALARADRSLPKLKEDFGEDAVKKALLRGGATKALQRTYRNYRAAAEGKREVAAKVIQKGLSGCIQRSLKEKKIREIRHINEAIKGVSNPDLFSHDDPNPLSDFYKKKLSELRSSIASGASNQQLDRLRDEVNTYIKAVKYFCASCVIKKVYYKEFADGESPLEETFNKFLWNKEIPEEDIQAMLNGTFLPLIKARERLPAAIAQEEKVKAILNGTFPPLIKAREHSSAATIQRAYRRYNQSK